MLDEGEQAIKDTIEASTKKSILKKKIGGMMTKDLDEVYNLVMDRKFPTAEELVYQVKLEDKKIFR